jgi:hypothetical protein
LILSENYNRAISTTLSLLDEALCEFDLYSKGHEIHSVLYEMRNHLPHAQREKLASVVAEMQGVLREVRDALQLESKVRDAEHSIRGSCTVLWISLSEIQGNGLRGYGEPPPGLTEYLNSRLEFLIRRLRTVSRMAARPGSGE